MSKEKDRNNLTERHIWGATVINTTSMSADDLHVTFSGSGGNLRNPRVISASNDCGDPQVSISTGNQVDVKWGSACITSGDTVLIVVENDIVPLEVVSTVWTRDGNPIEE